MFFAGPADKAVRRKLKARTKAAGIAPRNDNAKSGLVYTGKRFNATHRFLVEVDHLLRRFSVGHSGNVYGEDVTRVQAGLCHLYRKNRFEHHARPSQEYEGGGDFLDGKERETAIPAAGTAL